MSQNVAPSTETVKSNQDSVPQGRDSRSVTKRLQGELMNIVMLQNKDISAFPESDNIFKWVGTITGPSETVFESLVYKLSLEFSNGYPYSPPIVKFVTPCFHPNVDTNGNICLDILKEKWTALYDVQSILISIQSLLGEPNNKSPLNPSAAQMWSNQTAYKKHLHDQYHKNKTDKKD